MQNAHAMLTHSNIKSAFNAGKWRLYKARGLFSRSILCLWQELPSSNQGLFMGIMAKPRHGRALGAPTHLPGPVPLFLLMQNLCPMDIAGYDIMKLKSHNAYVRPCLVKG